MRRLISAFAALAMLAAPGAMAAPLVSPTDTVGAAMSFPDCPAPAVKDVRLRITTDAAGMHLFVHVIVQNVGHVGLFTAATAVSLNIGLGSRALASFPLEKLDAGEVRHLTVETLLPQGYQADDLVAALDLTDSRPGTAAAVDCDPSDNRIVRKGMLIKASLDRVAG